MTTSKKIKFSPIKSKKLFSPIKTKSKKLPKTSPIKVSSSSKIHSPPDSVRRTNDDTLKMLFGFEPRPNKDIGKIKRSNSKKSKSKKKSKKKKTRKNSKSNKKKTRK